MNVPDDDLELVSITVTKARAAGEGGEDDPIAAIIDALDTAQAPVFGDDKKKTYVVIEIVPDA